MLLASSGETNWTVIIIIGAVIFGGLWLRNYNEVRNMTEDEIEVERQQRAEYIANRQGREKQKHRVPGAKCPTCGSSDIARMTLTRRAASGVAGGIVFSKGARSQFRCESCRYMW